MFVAIYPGLHKVGILYIALHNNRWNITIRSGFQIPHMYATYSVLMSSFRYRKGKGISTTCALRGTVSFTQGGMFDFFLVICCIRSRQMHICVRHTHARINSVYKRDIKHRCRMTLLTNMLFQLEFNGHARLPRHRPIQGFSHIHLQCNRLPDTHLCSALAAR